MEGGSATLSPHPTGIVLRTLRPAPQFISLHRFLEMASNVPDRLATRPTPLPLNGYSSRAAGTHRFGGAARQAPDDRRAR